MLIITPLEQFQINTLGLGLTNFSLASICVVLTLLLLIIRGNNLISGVSSWNIFKIGLFTTIYELQKAQIKSKDSYSYYPLVITIFMLILVINLLGMIPYSYTLTAQFIITFSLSIPVFITMTGEALYRHGLTFFQFFIPTGTPIGLIPLISLIEIISYISRLFSLAIRLAANLLAGHILLKIFATGVFVSLNGWLITISILPFSLLTIFMLLELAVALIQAYVFTLLTCCYLNDAIELH